MKRPSKSSQQGMMLLEALFGILLFSIGIVALVGMHTSAVKQSVQAKFRADASLLATELIGQMWGTDRAWNTLSTGYSSANIVDGVCTSACAGNFSTWLTQVQSTLPGTVANPPSVTFTQVPGSAAGSTSTLVTITLNWQAPGADTAVHNFVAIANIK